MPYYIVIIKHYEWCYNVVDSPNNKFLPIFHKPYNSSSPQNVEIKTLLVIVLKGFVHLLSLDLSAVHYMVECCIVQKLSEEHYHRLE